MKPLALDLCCGKGGWSHGLLAAGWDVIGVDTENKGDYPSQLILSDVRKLSIKLNAKIDLVVASPPCNEFSYRSFPFKRCRELAATVPPDKSIWRACEKIAKDLNAPLVLENVKGAVRYMGKAAARYGPYYLWGDVPALIPSGKHVTKGFTRNRETKIIGGSFGGNSYHSKTEFAQARDIKYSEFNRGESAHTSSKSNARKEWSAKIAMIPFELAYYIGCYYMEKL